MNFKRVPGLFVVAICALFAGALSAHEWQSTSAPLSSFQIENVLDALVRTADEARAEGWTATGPDASNPISRFYEYALSLDGPIVIGEAFDRVLVAYEAFRLGEVDAAGAFIEGADVLRWLDFLHPSDVVAIQPYLDHLTDWWASVPGAGQ